jgi:hypothetical protein
MAGSFGGKSVRYLPHGQRVLRGGFIKLQMIDAGSPPQHEADVFIGFDANANDYIAHWLDRFGAPGARVVARGERQGQRLVLFFPYAVGAAGIPGGQRHMVDLCELQPDARRADLARRATSGTGAVSTYRGRFSGAVLLRRVKAPQALMGGGT